MTIDIYDLHIKLIPSVQIPNRNASFSAETFGFEQKRSKQKNPFTFIYASCITAIVLHINGFGTELSINSRMPFSYHFFSLKNHTYYLLLVFSVQTDLSKYCTLTNCLSSTFNSLCMLSIRQTQNSVLGARHAAHSAHLDNWIVSYWFQ